MLISFALKQLYSFKYIKREKKNLLHLPGYLLLLKLTVFSEFSSAK